MVQAKLGSVADSRTTYEALLGAIADSRTYTEATLGAVAETFAGVRAKMAAEARYFPLAGWHVYATDTATDTTTFLGFTEYDDGTLTDVSLADGEYLIEARPTYNFWQQTQAPVFQSVTISAAALDTDLPLVVDLVGENLDGYTTIEWNAGSLVSETDEWGVWVSATTPVNTTGTPDFTVEAHILDTTDVSPSGARSYSRVLDVEDEAQYTFRHEQTSSMYYAVAYRQSGANGTVEEVYVPVDTDTVVAPDPVGYTPVL